MNAETGAPIEGAEHLAQSIGDILSTPIGSRVMLRDYGSLIPELLDQPRNAATKLQLLAAGAVAIARWEPRYRLARIQIAEGEGGGAVAELEGEFLERPGANAFLRLTLPLRAAAAGQA
jgi:hypothetical protein